MMNQSPQSQTAIEIRPQPRQEVFLSSSADIVIYGGAAGGGKTWALLLEPLRHIDNRKFGAVIFRRTIPEITREGGMWDEAGEIYPLIGARPNENEHHFTFNAGSRITFSHLQHETDLIDWRGAQVALIEFDQLETFTRKQFFYMMSRNRSTCGVRPYIRATCNPEPGWLAEFMAWWIDEDGFANLDRVGVVRWFFRDGDAVVWADSKQALLDQYPESFPKSATFILSTIYDNPILLQKDPGYLANLKNLDYIDRQRLLGDPKRGGNWKIKPTAGKVFNRGWFDIVPAAPAGGVTVRFWDFASTSKQLSKKDPDFTAGVLMRQVRGEYYILDCSADQLGPAAVVKLFVNTSFQDASRCKSEGSQYRCRWEEEPGSASKRESQRLAQLLAGIDALGVPAQGDKLVRAKALSSQSESGNVHLVAGDWNERWLEHMHAQPEWPHDDIMDGSSGAYNELVLGGGLNVF